MNLLAEVAPELLDGKRLIDLARWATNSAAPIANKDRDVLQAKLLSVWNWDVLNALTTGLNQTSDENSYNSMLARNEVAQLRLQWWTANDKTSAYSDTSVASQNAGPLQLKTASFFQDNWLNATGDIGLLNETATWLRHRIESETATSIIEIESPMMRYLTGQFSNPTKALDQQFGDAFDFSMNAKRASLSQIHEKIIGQSSMILLPSVELLQIADRLPSSAEADKLQTTIEFFEKLASRNSLQLRAGPQGIFEMLFQTGQLREILKAATGVSIVANETTNSDRMGALLGVNIDRFYGLPVSLAARPLFPDDICAPTFYSEISETLGQLRPKAGEVFLVEAGPVRNIVSGLIAQRGGIALEVGAYFFANRAS